MGRNNNEKKEVIDRMTLGCFFLLVLAVVMAVTPWGEGKAEALSLQEYLREVHDQNHGIKGSTGVSEGAKLRSEEGQLLFTPAFFANGQMALDEKPTLNPAAQGKKTTAQVYAFGLAQQMKFGLQAKFSYNLLFTELQGANPLFVPNPKNVETRPTLELNLPLWRNRGGSEFQAMQVLSRAQALATSYGESFKVKVTMAGAEGAYWRLVLARDVVKVQEEALERAHKLQSWSSRRASLQLGDRSDFLQAETAVKAKEMELMAAKNEAQAAQRLFNSMRAVSKNTVEEKLLSLDDRLLENITLPVKVEMRDDLKAAMEMQKLSEANAVVASEKNKPTLEAFAGHSWNGRNSALGESVEQSLSPRYPTTSIGIRFNMPLDQNLLANNREGYEREKAGVALNVQQKIFDQEREWNDLTQKLGEAKERLKLVKSFESQQREKSRYEQERFDRGRTTTYQVIMFQQDYANSQLAKIKVQSEILGLLAQMKTFGGAE